VIESRSRAGSTEVIGTRGQEHSSFKEFLLDEVHERAAQSLRMDTSRSRVTEDSERRLTTQRAGVTVEDAAPDACSSIEPRLSVDRARTTAPQSNVSQPPENVPTRVQQLIQHAGSTRSTEAAAAHSDDHQAQRQSGETVSKGATPQNAAATRSAPPGELVGLLARAPIQPVPSGTVASNISNVSVAASPPAGPPPRGTLKQLLHPPQRSSPTVPIEQSLSHELSEAIKAGKVSLRLSDTPVGEVRVHIEKLESFAHKPGQPQPLSIEFVCQSSAAALQLQQSSSTLAHQLAQRGFEIAVMRTRVHDVQKGGGADRVSTLLAQAGEDRGTLFASMYPAAHA
jgi:hypothetical protein